MASFINWSSAFLSLIAPEIELIREQWDNILHLIATIKLKLTPASQVFKQLNSYSKQHKLYQALKAFGQSIKTLFILTYIDDVRLRQAIEKQLNKVEHSQKFAKAVYHGGNQEFLQATKEEQEKAEACKRLIQSAIILWNSSISPKRSWKRRTRHGNGSSSRSFNQAQSSPSLTCICRGNMTSPRKKCGTQWGLTSPKFWRLNLTKIGSNKNSVLIDILRKSIFATPLYANLFTNTQRCNTKWY